MNPDATIMNPTNQPPQPPGDSNKPIPDYYKNFSVDFSKDVINFDSLTGGREVESLAKHVGSTNFVLNFGPKDAWCLCNASENSLIEVVSATPPSEFDCTWIQLWYPHKQKALIQTLAEKYDFSPRLTALIQTDPKRPPPSGPQDGTHDHHHRFHRHAPKPTKLSSESSQDAEQANSVINSTPLDNVPKDMVRHLTHYDIVDSIWHWSSIDTDKKYICLGYNSLHNVKPLRFVSEKGKRRKRTSFLPDGKRIWNWLILCHDKTVISITESPLDPVDSSRSAQDLSANRKNLSNLLEQLSATTDRSSRSAISIIPVRELLENGSIDTAGAAGLLFYYLFDDWYSTYGLLAKSGHQYGAELNNIREEMKIKASLDRVDDLYCLGRQLAVLKLVYHSYMLLIDKLLDRQRSTGVSRSTNYPTEESLPPQHTQLVPLIRGAQDRFERLRDRINLYVVSEIQECIDIKDSLLSMNFNLISIKESDAVERLTRITILLGKATILFLPVSLMATYFSINFSGLEYTPTQFWVAFAVILFLSFLGLFGFGLVSGTTEGDMVYKPIYEVFYNILVGWWSVRRDNT